MPLTTNSDSEDDLDYVPPEDEHDSNSSDDQDEVDNAAQGEPPKSDPIEQKKQRDALWASFQASVSTPPLNGAGPGSSAPAVNRVKIEKTYLFAGKRVTEVVEVTEDSEEVKKWPRWKPHTPTAEATPGLTLTSSPDRDGGEMGKRNDKDDHPMSPAPAPGPVVTVTPPPTAITTPAPASKRPGPRKPRTVLPSIPKAPQAKKITTLDKSAMDWRAHVASQSGDVKDELDANRRGGGYLEKVDFLKRVEDRREDVLEASKASKRRKT